MAGEQCDFRESHGKCGKEARLFMITPYKSRKVWYCIEHYDRMAAYYKWCVREQDRPDDWCEDMVRVNGW